jgi:hypothetical protein
MVPIGFAVDSATEMEGRLGGRGYTRGLQKTMTKTETMTRVCLALAAQTTMKTATKR